MSDVAAVEAHLPVDPADWPTGAFDIIYADPPWSYRDKAMQRGGAERHYKTMGEEALLSLPVARLGRTPSALFLWATMPNLPLAFRVMAAWGYQYKTMAFVWGKMNMDNTLFKGMGHYTRANCELCLLGTRGRALKRHDKSVPQLQLSPRLPHSVKPPNFRQSIERLYGYGRTRVELFARRPAVGWHVWGDEVCQ